MFHLKFNRVINSRKKNKKTVMKVNEKVSRIESNKIMQK